MKTAFLIPVFQEKISIVSAVISEILENSDHAVYIGDDGNTPDLKNELKAMARSFEDKYPGRVHVHYSEKNSGQGYTLKILTREALEANDYFVTFDSDGQHRFPDAQAMLKQLEASQGKLNVILGSRFLGHKNITMPWQRKVLLLVARVFMKLVLGYNITDPQCGLRAFDKTFAAKVMVSLESDGMAHANEILDRIFSDRSLKMQEYPVDIIYNKYTLVDGQSNFGIFKVALDFFRYKFKRMGSRWFHK